MSLSDLFSARALEEGVPFKVVLREALQTYTLHALVQQKGAKALTFQGGTALRLLYQGPRYSDDLDFVCQDSFSSLVETFQELGLALEKLSPLFGAQLSLLKQKEEGKLLRYRLHMRAPSEADSTTVSIEIAGFPAYTRALKPIRPTILLPGLPLVLAWVETEEEILADKLVALAGRTYLKGRDLFDIWFLRGRGTALVPSLVRSKFLDYGVAPESLWKRLITISPETLRREMGAFLPKHYRQPLETDNYTDVLEAVRSTVLEFLSS